MNNEEPGPPSLATKPMHSCRVCSVGRQYDKNGNMRQWWNNATIRKFRDRAQCIVDQYSSYTLEPFGHQVSPGVTPEGQGSVEDAGSG